MYVNKKVTSKDLLDPLPKPTYEPEYKPCPPEMSFNATPPSTNKTDGICGGLETERIFDFNYSPPIKPFPEIGEVDQGFSSGGYPMGDRGHGWNKRPWQFEPAMIITSPMVEPHPQQLPETMQDSGQSG